MPFLENVELFIDEYTMTIQTPVAAELHVSADILEETLLKMAGIATQPTNCVTEWVEASNQIRFLLTGLTEQDDQAFAAYLAEPGAFVQKSEGISEFLISEAMAQERLLPEFQAWVRDHMQNDPAVFKKYLHPMMLLPLMCNSYSGFYESLCAENIPNEADLTRINERMETLGENFGIALNFLGNADAAYRGKRQKPLQEFCEDLRELKQDAAISGSAEITRALDRAILHISLCLIAITPEHYLKANHRQLERDAQGHLVRFFSKPILDTLVARCESDNEAAASSSDEENSPAHSDVEEPTEEEVVNHLRSLQM